MSLLMTAVAGAGPTNYALVNHSGLHLRWTVDSVPAGAIFTTPQGLIPPQGGATIARWEPAADDQSPPDVMAAVTWWHVATADDLARFNACLSGPDIPFPAGCEWMDFDYDGDVDQIDYGVIQRCLFD